MKDDKTRSRKDTNPIFHLLKWKLKVIDQMAKKVSVLQKRVLKNLGSTPEIMFNFINKNSDSQIRF